MNLKAKQWCWRELNPTPKPILQLTDYTLPTMPKTPTNCRSPVLPAGFGDWWTILELFCSATVRSVMAIEPCGGYRAAESAPVPYSTAAP